MIFAKVAVFFSFFALFLSFRGRVNQNGEKRPERFPCTPPFKIPILAILVYFGVAPAHFQKRSAAAAGADTSKDSNIDDDMTI